MDTMSDSGEPPGGEDALAESIADYMATRTTPWANEAEMRAAVHDTVRLLCWDALADLRKVIAGRHAQYCDGDPCECGAAPRPTEAQIEAALRAWVGDRTDGRNPLDSGAPDVDAFARHARVRMKLALEAAAAVGGADTPRAAASSDIQPALADAARAALDWFDRGVTHQVVVVRKLRAALAAFDARSTPNEET